MFGPIGKHEFHLNAVLMQVEESIEILLVGVLIPHDEDGDLLQRTVVLGQGGEHGGKGLDAVVVEEHANSDILRTREGLA